MGQDFYFAFARNVETHTTVDCFIAGLQAVFNNDSNPLSSWKFLFFHKKNVPKYIVLMFNSACNLSFELYN